MIRSLGWLALNHGVGRFFTFTFFLALPMLLPIGEVGRFTLVYTALLVAAQPLLETPLELLLTTAAAGGDLATVRRLFAALVTWLPPILVVTWWGGWGFGAPGLLLALLLLNLGLTRIQAGVFATLRGLDRPRLEGLVGLAQRITALVLLVVVAHGLGRRAEAPALAMLLAASAGCLVMVTVFRRELTELARRVWRATPTSEGIVALARRGLVLGAVGVVGALYLRVDVLLLGFLDGAAPVGRYFTAARVLEASYALPHLLMLAVLPRLVVADSFERLFRRSAIGLAVLGALATAGLAVLAPPVLERLYPGEGPAIGELVVALAPAAVPVYVGYLATQGLVVLGRPQRWLLLAAVGLVVDVVLDVVLIPTYGARGAAWATIVTETAVVVPAVVSCLASAPKIRKV